ncbi:MAG: HD domain-containing protein [Nitrospiraceae bacterium]|nr:MAG: HD domain-containing protein [Nitrospiraceae bacterium]
MSKPSIRTITVRSMVNFLLLASVILLIIIGIGFRVISYNVIKSKTVAISEVIIAGLTSHMKAGIMDKRDYFLEEIKFLHEVEDVALIRSSGVSGQFGSGYEIEREMNPETKKVFETREPVFIMNEFNINPHVRAYIPYIATREGKLNCLECHDAREGEVLGAVDITLNLTAYRNLALGIMIAITVLSTVFVILICINTFKTVQRHIKEPLEHLMVKAKDAYFSQIPLEPDVFESLEFDDIARKFNMFNTAVLANQSLIKEKNLELLAMNDEIEDTLKETVFTMGVVEEQRSKETRDHTRRVSRYCNFLATKLGLSERDIYLIAAASPLHDIGKLGIPDSILFKPGKLTDDEFEIVKNHSGIGYAMLLHSSRDILKAAAIIAYQHHEKWDGTGYPQGLKGEDIHIYGRIIALADVFDALTSDRIYRPAWDDSDVISWIHRERGKHFEPALVDIFMQNLNAFFEIKENCTGSKDNKCKVDVCGDVETTPATDS